MSKLTPRAWAALIAVYVVWGSTYLAIRVVVRTMPPLLSGGTRFLVAGAIMYAYGIGRGEPARDRPTLRQWRNAAVIGAGLCLGGNGLVSIAEKRVESGMAALIVASVALWFAFFEWAWFKARMTRVSFAGLVAGFAGVGLLVRPQPGEAGVDTVGAATLIAATMFWAAGSLFARRADLPARPAVGTGMQMFAGGVLMCVVAAAGGEFGRLELASIEPEAWVAWVYLIVAGALVGFASYAWLIRNVKTSIVATYGYVNPLVAVVLGWVILDERLTWSTAVAGAIIVGSVATIVAANGGSPRGVGAVPPDERPDLSAEEVPA